VLFVTNNIDRIFSRTMAAYLNTMPDRPWAELRKGKAINERWLAEVFRPYRIHPKTIWIGEDHAKGYLQEDFMDSFRRYISKSELEALKEELRKAPKAPATPETPAGNGSTGSGPSAAPPEKASQSGSSTIDSSTTPPSPEKAPPQDGSGGGDPTPG
jgi:hypothetical protein